MTAGTPWVLIVPSLFVEFFQAPEDYYERTWVGSLGRLARFLAFFLAISLPSIYVALASFQPELIPFKLLSTLAMFRKEVPFPALIEIVLMEIIVQLLIEAGIRMPTAIAAAIGVVGGIILGQAAISSKLASPSVIVVVIITTISTFVIPTFTMVLVTRLLRFPLLLLTGVFGFFGLSLGWFFILTHLVDLESFGVPYFAPFGPVRYGDLKDSIVRTFIWNMNNRPVSIPTQDLRRQGDRRRGRNT